MGEWTNDEILLAIRITNSDMDMDLGLYCDTGKMCVGGGMHCPCVSSLYYVEHRPNWHGTSSFIEVKLGTFGVYFTDKIMVIVRCLVNYCIVMMFSVLSQMILDIRHVYVCVWSVLASNAYCLASSVSSRLLEAIATAEGVNFEVRLMHIMCVIVGSFCRNAIPTCTGNVSECDVMCTCVCRRHWQDSSGWAIKLVSWWKLARPCCLHLKKPLVITFSVLIDRWLDQEQMRFNGWLFTVGVGVLSSVQCFDMIGPQEGRLMCDRILLQLCLKVLFWGILGWTGHVLLHIDLIVHEVMFSKVNARWRGHHRCLVADMVVDICDRRHSWCLQLHHQGQAPTVHHNACRNVVAHSRDLGCLKCPKCAKLYSFESWYLKHLSRCPQAVGTIMDWTWTFGVLKLNLVKPG